MLVITAKQRQVLELMANGSEPWQDHDEYNGQEVWWWHHPNHQVSPRTINTNTARALVRLKLIEPTGMLYWRLTESGRSTIGK